MFVECGFVRVFRGIPSDATLSELIWLPGGAPFDVGQRTGFPNMIPTRHALSANRGLPPLRFRLGNWDKWFDKFPQPVRQQFDGHWTTPGCRDVSTLLGLVDQKRLLDILMVKEDRSVRYEKTVSYATK
jgi:hypothetical protein